MNKFKILILFAAIACVSFHCTKEGPMGPAGKDGVDGSDGANGANGDDGQDGNDGEDDKAGNANVRVYHFTDGPYNLATEQDFTCNSSADTSNNSLWPVYIFNGSYIYPIPGHGPAGANIFRTYFYIG